MTSLLIRRAVITALTLFAASLLIFALLWLLGGDPATSLLGVDTTPAAARALRKALGLNVPLWKQYTTWASGMLHGDLGVSIVSDRRVAPQILHGAAVTAPLALLGMAGALLIAVPAGMLGALYSRKPAGLAISFISQIGLAFPAFWLGLLFSWLFAVHLHWLPAGGFVPWSQSTGGALKSLILPVLSLSLVRGATLQRYVQATISDVLHESYIRTARSKGLTRGRALTLHGLRNAAIPILTVATIQFGIMLGGVVVIENVYFLPGVGSLVVTAVTQRDLVLVRSTVMVLVAVVILVNFVTDMLYAVLDPRTRVVT